MPLSETRWNTVTESEYSWEREALQFVRDRLPDHEPYRAWANFEFIADDGSINEVDLLVLSPKGFYLVEIKSWPGEIRGDAGTWVWTRPDGGISTRDNPLLLTNRKAKKLVSLLQRQKAMQKRRLPFLEPRIFLSDVNVRCALPSHLMSAVHLRDVEGGDDQKPRRGIIAALTRWTAGADDDPGTRRIDKPMSKAVSQALMQAGIRRSEKTKRVGQYVLKDLIEEGQGFQDWAGDHTDLENDHARVRIYAVQPGAGEGEREASKRSAEREYRILQGVSHPAILRANAYQNTERGPALFFEHDPRAERLDHYLKQRAEDLSVATRLDLLRSIAEGVGYAHKKKLVHRALGPQSVLVLDPGSESPRIKLYNWQTGLRSAGTSATRPSIAGTTHPGQLVDDASMIYMAPEVVVGAGHNSGEAADVFSLGALAYQIFSGIEPASSLIERDTQLRQNRGLDIAAVMDGAGKELRDLIQQSTCPELGGRIDSVDWFLHQLEAVEEELTAPEDELVVDPKEAKKGDVLPGGYRILSRLGSGSSAITFLVDRGDGEEVVLKLSSGPENDARLRAEAEVLAKVRHQNIVAFKGAVPVGERVGILMERAGTQILSQRLRAEGRIQPELLQRFGNDLLTTVDWLEQEGIAHRDIKPDNIGVKAVDKKRLVLLLFDFSLARTPTDDIRAGTRPYLDPFLSLRTPPRWDIHAERFAAAMTLYEMATGSLPKWGDGESDPAMVDDEVTLEVDLLEADLRTPLAEFFGKALRRDVKERFDTCEEMRAAWNRAFEGGVRAAERKTSTAELDAALADARPDTMIESLPVGTRVLAALERLQIRTVTDLLMAPMMRIYGAGARGVGSETKREIRDLVDRLGLRFPDIELGVETPIVDDPADETSLGFASVDALERQVFPARTNLKETERSVSRLLTGLDELPKVAINGWPSQTEVTEGVDVTRGRVSQIVRELRTRWAKITALNDLREQIVEVVEAHGGVITANELSVAVLASRGSARTEPARNVVANAVMRAAVEAEHTRENVRFHERRTGACVLISRRAELADYAEKLGRAADKLATTDPLPGPARVREALEQVARPAGLEIDPTRLVNLAAAASAEAAVSSKFELYPRGLSADRALKLASGAVLGAAELNEQDLRDRVASRYPEAAKLPGRPALDTMLRQVGLGLEWSNERRVYLAREFRSRTSRITQSTTITRLPTSADGVEFTPEVADARQFEERLQHAADNGAFLALTVRPSQLALAERQLAEKFPVHRLSLEEALIAEMRAFATEHDINWEVVLTADAADRDSKNWGNLLRVARGAFARLRERLTSADQTLLLPHLGLLARYDSVDLIDFIRERVDARDGLKGAWLLIASDEQQVLPAIDGRPVPVITPAQWARIPDAWLRNLHRAGSGALGEPAL